MSLISKTKEFIKNNDIHKIITTIFSQGMLSVANFIIAIIIAKYATKEEYGLYVFFFSFIGIFHGYHSAVISAPLMVLVNHKIGRDRDLYVASLSVGRNYILVPILMLFSFTIIIYKTLTHSEQNYIVASLFMAIVIWMYIAKEYYRTLHFTLLNTNAVFWMDLLMLAVILVGSYMIVINGKVSAVGGFVILCFGYVSSYLYGKSRTSYEKPKKLRIKESLKENWSHGKWLVVGIFSSLFQSRAYIYIVSAVISLGALADVSASRLFLMPIGLLNISAGKILVAKGSIMVSKHEHRLFRKFLSYFILALIVIWFLYFVSILFMYDTLIKFLGEKYQNIYGLTVLWGIFFLVFTVRYLLGMVIIVYKRFKKQAKYDIFGAITVIASCFIFVLYMGEAGAIAVFYALFVGFVIKRRLTWKLLGPESRSGSGRSVMWWSLESKSRAPGSSTPVFVSAMWRPLDQVEPTGFRGWGFWKFPMSTGTMPAGTRSICS